MTIPRPSPPLALTMGEPAGIGPGLAAAAWRARKRRNIPLFFLIGDPAALSVSGKALHFHTIESPTGAHGVFPKALPVLALKAPAPICPGRPDPVNASAVIGAIETAVKLALTGAAAAVVTCPIHKQTLIDGGFRFAGHTEFLGKLAGAAPVMMLLNRHVRTVPVTGHLSLRNAAGALTPDLIIRTAEIVTSALKVRFGINNPRLAATGLNPHAGEGGKLGDEETRIIVPALRALAKRGIKVDGPLPGDSAFIEANRKRYDAFLAMTHDQALIPVKTLDFRGTVNVTLGLPFVRTSPAHGTALDLVKAGTKADAESLIQALLLATKLAGAKR